LSRCHDHLDEAGDRPVAPTLVRDYYRWALAVKPKKARGERREWGTGRRQLRAGSPAARSLSLMEAVIGIMYVATMIGRFVSIQSNEKLERS
jgi:hypothetical protein